MNSVITWPCVGMEESVYVAGSFLAWAEIVPLERTESGDYSVNCCFPVRASFLCRVAVHGVGAQVRSMCFGQVP